MKKLLLILVSLLACLSFCALSEGDTYYCGHYRYVLLPDGTAKITDYRGAGYTAADYILQIPEKLDNHPVSAIGDLAFHRCLFHEHIIIPDSVTAIGTFSFADCPALTEMTIPDSIETMAINPFAFCQNLTKFNVSMENPNFYVIDGVLFNTAEKKLISYPHALSASSSYVIPEGTLAIGEAAFHSCRALTEITIPSSVTIIEESSFSYVSENLLFTVDKGSYAETWAIENGFDYQFSNSLDWLNH